MNGHLNRHEAGRNWIRVPAAILMAVILVFAFCSCAKHGYYDHLSDSGYNNEPGFSHGNVSEFEQPQSAQEGSEAKVNEKLIKEVDIAAETLNFDEAKNDILEQVSKAGGYISNSKISGGERLEYNKTLRSAEFEIRIPQENLSEFLKEVGGRINIYSSQERVTDATETYYDIQARLDTLNSKKTALTEMLEKAEDVSQIIDIQDKLYDTIADIEAYTARLKVIDSKVAYSTIYLKLNEVEVYTQTEEESFGTRIANSFRNGWAAFVDGWKDFTVWFVGALPGLLLFAAFVVVAIFILRAIVKKSNKKAAERAEAARAEAARRQQEEYQRQIQSNG